MYPAQTAAREPDRPAVIMAGSGASIPYRELEARSNQLAHFFRGRGLRRTDHVAYVLENHLRYVELMAAAERTGLYYTCVNSHLRADELAYILADCGARVVVSSPRVRGAVLAATARLDPAPLLLEVDSADPPEPLASYDAAIAGLPEVPVPDEELGASMLYSSGTTGRPKGVLRPLPVAHPSEPLPVFAFVHRVMFRLRAGMTYLAPTPLYHSAPQSAISGAVRLGATTVVMERFDAEQYLALIERHRVTHTQVVPTMLHRIMRLPAEVRERYDLSSLEVLVHAAAPCPVPLKRAVIDWLGPVVHEYYASTEAIGGTVIDSEEWLAHPGSVGRPAFGDLQIRDGEGRPVPAGTPGRVWFGGASSFEYLNDPAKTAETFDGEGSAVGDIGYVDDDGYLYLTDRESFMILSGGVNVYPQETENVLSGHPGVLDVAVFGVPDEDLGEVVVALVVPAPEGGPDLVSQLEDHCREHLATIKCPRSIELVASLPRTEAGKLLKAQLRDRYISG